MKDEVISCEKRVFVAWHSINDLFVSTSQRRNFLERRRLSKELGGTFGRRHLNNDNNSAKGIRSKNAGEVRNTEENVIDFLSHLLNSKVNSWRAEGRVILFEFSATSRVVRAYNAAVS